MRVFSFFRKTLCIKGIHHTYIAAANRAKYVYYFWEVTRAVSSPATPSNHARTAFVAEYQSRSGFVFFFFFIPSLPKIRPHNNSLVGRAWYNEKARNFNATHPCNYITVVVYTRLTTSDLLYYSITGRT